MLTVIFLICFLVSLKYAWWAPSIDLKHTRIMMYHMISEQLNSGKKSGLRVSPDMFEKQLKWFTDNNWKFIKMSEIEKYKDHEKVVAITFDDGYEDNYLKALPLLKKYKACATLYLVLDRNNNDWSIKKNPKHNSGALVRETKVSDEQIFKMLDSDVFELGGHTITHPYLLNADTKEKEREILGCKTELEAKFNTNVKSFAYPFGQYDSEDKQIVHDSDFDTAVTTKEGVACLNDKYELKRIKASGKDKFFEFKLRVIKGFRGYI
tara:strand:- start:448 stop:1242 length:795 start_codon:yes stop_codon:yes gene_type:complete